MILIQTFLILFGAEIHAYESATKRNLRKDVLSDPRTMTIKTNDDAVVVPVAGKQQQQQKKGIYELPDEAQKWCQPSKLEPLDYEACDHDGVFMNIPLMAGLTNGLKFMLLMVIDSFEKNRCLF